MATLSTLELMLHGLQNQENLEPYGGHEPPPKLPQRPVSRGRTPLRRPKRAILSFHFHDFDGKKEEFAGNISKRDGFAFVEGDNCCQPNDGIGGLVLSKNKIKNNGEEGAEKGIIGIQKCFRGYHARFHYHKLKEGIITLQSFVRGENARKELRNSIKRCTSIPTQTDVQKVRKKLSQETTIIYLQSVVRGWLSRRRLGYHGSMKNVTIENIKEANHPHKENEKSEEHVTVSKSYIFDLEKQVLRIETALRNKRRENSNLELQLKQIDRKWELHKAKMDSMEKTWQDEFTSIQLSLASAREKMAREITHLPRNLTQRQGNGKVNLTIREILELQEREMHEIDSNFCVGDVCNDVLNSRKYHEEEYRKLKGRFKIWKKNFKARLHEIKRTLDRYDHLRAEKIQKTCCVI